MLKKVISTLLITMGLIIPFSYFSIEEIKETTYLKKINKDIVENSYFAILDIPKINIKHELYNIDNPKNDVDKNLYLLPSSTFPGNNIDSNIIIAGHSGMGANAYFASLYKLNISDKINIYYNKFIYTYEIKEIEYQKKTGTLYLKKDSQDMITLITCTKNNNKTQIIYYAKLQKIAKIL